VCPQTHRDISAAIWVRRCWRTVTAMSACHVREIADHKVNLVIAHLVLRKAWHFLLRPSAD
jgi:hypothetical protein